tara:strand:- start:729 stop:929 length:201 start_codon:yes stop_codon:yes gene_type:complete
MLPSVAPETAPPSAPVVLVAAPVVAAASVVVLVLESVDDFVVELSAAGSVAAPSVVGTTVLVVSVF